MSKDFHSLQFEKKPKFNELVFLILDILSYFLKLSIN
jgi:hypothetical protein